MNTGDERAPQVEVRPPLDDLAHLQDHVTRQFQQLRGRVSEMARLAETAQAGLQGPQGPAPHLRGGVWGRRVAVLLVGATALTIAFNVLSLAGAPDRPLRQTASSREARQEPGAGNLYTVPKVEGLSASQAMVALMSAGLRMGAAIPTKGALGLVVGTRPAAGMLVRPGTRVTVLVGVSEKRLKHER
jgi:hypothetical protein